MKYYLLLFILFPSLTACNSGHRKPATVQQKRETPKALKEETADVSYISKSRLADLVEELYDELVEKDSSLKNIELMIASYRGDKPGSLEPYNVFNSKNQSYFNSAYNHLAEIKDSLLAQRIKAAIVDGGLNYSNKISGFEAIIKELEKKTASIDDLHVALKITTTLAVMKKFQQDNLPSSKPVEAVLRTGEKIIATESAAIIH